MVANPAVCNHFFESGLGQEFVEQPALVCALISHEVAAAMWAHALVILHELETAAAEA